MKVVVGNRYTRTSGHQRSCASYRCSLLWSRRENIEISAYQNIRISEYQNRTISYLDSLTERSCPCHEIFSVSQRPRVPIDPGEPPDHSHVSAQSALLTALGFALLWGGPSAVPHYCTWCSFLAFSGCFQVWELRGMDHTVSPQSRATYSRQGGRLLDLCMVDNSHSVASASSDGTVHVRHRRACERAESSLAAFLWHTLSSLKPFLTRPVVACCSSAASRPCLDCVGGC